LPVYTKTEKLKLCIKIDVAGRNICTLIVIRFWWYWTSRAVFILLGYENYL